MSARRTGLAIFALLFVHYGWFHQGGGWNQNVRYAQVRALAQGHASIDDELLYVLEARADGTTGYRALPLSDAASSAQLPRAVSLDLSQQGDRLYPNKPPGLSVLALPGHALASAFLRLLGLDPGSWWTLSLALYLTTVLSVGLLSALGGLVFHDVARRLFPEARAGSVVAASLAYGLGTPVFAYATFLIDHAVVASLSLLAFRYALVAREEEEGRGRALFLSGTVAGLAVLVNNSAAITALALGAYVLATQPARARAVAYAAGGIAPALLLGAYQWACFGHPLDLPQDHQLAMFQTGSPLLGIFGTPRWGLLPRLLVMPYRGLLFWSPVLLPGLVAMALLVTRRARRPEALLFLAIFLAFWAMNTSFNAWHGGGTFGPRYLVPAVPFIALPLVLAFERARAVTAIFAVASVALALLVTAISPQVDAGLHRPLTQFYLPLARGESVASGGHVQRGPVSVHPVGYVGSGLESLDANGEIARWSSFNLGEVLFPERWWSLAPLGLAWLLFGLALRRRT